MHRHVNRLPCDLIGTWSHSKIPTYDSTFCRVTLAAWKIFDRWCAGRIISPAGQDFRQMADADAAVCAMQAAAHLHQASAVVGDDELGAALLDAFALVGQHRGGDVGELH